MTINSSSLRHDMYSAFYTLVSAVTSSWGASATPTVYGGYPDLSTISFPNIIIEPVSVRESEFTVDTTRNNVSSDIFFIIHIYSKKNQDLDLIADGINAAIKGTPIQGALLMGIDSDNNDMIVANEQKVKGKTLSIHYLRRG